MMKDKKVPKDKTVPEKKHAVESPPDLMDYETPSIKHYKEEELVDEVAVLGCTPFPPRP